MRVAITYAVAGAATAFVASKVFGNPTTLVGLQIMRVLTYCLVVTALFPLLGHDEQTGHPASKLAVPLALLFLSAAVVVIYEPIINYGYQLRLPPRSWQLTLFFEPYVLFYGAALGAATRFAIVAGELQGPRRKLWYKITLTIFFLIALATCVYLSRDIRMAVQLGLLAS
jgi:hypothetical protein